jgi:glyoxylase-like metal-dependent hydrolase (beta-lactamase superfamily II)
MFIFKFTFGPAQTNALLVGCPLTKKGAIIDPSPGSSSSLLQKMQELGLTVEKILLTHSHWDHFADAALLKRKLNIPLYVHALDVKNLIEPGSDGLPLFFPIEPVEADGFFKEGDVVDVGDLQAEVIHTPGHSPGGVCFYFRSEKCLISGDTLFKGSFGNISFPTSEPEKMWTSLEKLAKLPSETRVVPGHGAETII